MLKKEKLKYKEIDEGAIICQAIKNELYADQSWSRCYMQIASQFSLLKKKATLDKLLELSNEEIKSMCST